MWKFKNLCRVVECMPLVGWKSQQKITKKLAHLTTPSLYHVTLYPFFQKESGHPWAKTSCCYIRGVILKTFQGPIPSLGAVTRANKGSRHISKTEVSHIADHLWPSRGPWIWHFWAIEDKRGFADSHYSNERIKRQSQHKYIASIFSVAHAGYIEEH